MNWLDQVKVSSTCQISELFSYLFEEIEFTTNAKSSIQVAPCTTAMQKFHTSYMRSSLFCHLLICHHSINAANVLNIVIKLLIIMKI